MKNASLSILFCIFLCFFLVFQRDLPENEPEFAGEIKVYNHLTGEIFSMGLEEYTARCMSSEMPSSFHIEALKAQAVAIRSYTLSKKADDLHKGARVCTDFNHCAAFSDEKEELSAVYKEAVEATKNQVLLYNGKIANTVFHAMSSGKTENAEDVWGGKVPYLVSADCDCDRMVKNYTTVQEFTKKQIEDSLDVSEISVGKIEKTESGGVKSINIGGKTIKGSEVRKALGLRSSAFDVEKNDNGLKFTVYGYGHGVGMSQYGADGFARSGMDYKEILAHFYKGTELISIDFDA